MYDDGGIGPRGDMWLFILLWFCIFAILAGLAAGLALVWA